MHILLCFHYQISFHLQHAHSPQSTCTCTRGPPPCLHPHYSTCASPTSVAEWLGTMSGIRWPGFGPHLHHLPTVWLGKLLGFFNKGKIASIKEFTSWDGWRKYRSDNTDQALGAAPGTKQAPLITVIALYSPVDVRIHLPKYKSHFFKNCQIRGSFKNISLLFISSLIEEGLGNSLYETYYLLGFSLWI